MKTTLKKNTTTPLRISALLLLVTLAANAAFRVTFNPQGGSVTPAYRDYNPGDTYGTLPTPSYTGYSFLGWFLTPTGLAHPEFNLFFCFFYLI